MITAAWIFAAWLPLATVVAVAIGLACRWADGGDYLPAGVKRTHTPPRSVAHPSRPVRCPDTFVVASNGQLIEVYL